jgi:ABC-type iron transport system FetAB permease component
MPLIGTGDVLGEAILAAQDAAASSFINSHSTPLSAADQATLRHVMAKAMGNAIITHLTATAGTGAVAVPGAQAGVVILPGNLL